MLRKLGLTAILILLATIVCAQPVRLVPIPQDVAANTSIRITLANQWDLDGEAADADQVVASVAFEDSKSDYTIAANPDVCRLVDMTVTDANSSITAGIVTITGTDCLGYAKTCTFDFSVAATRGSGAKTLTGSGFGGGCYLATVTSVANNALTGEEGAGTDTFTVGYTSNSQNGWKAWGTLLPVGPSGEHGVDPFSATYVATLITTSNALSTTVTGTGAFTDVAVGDLLLIPETNNQGKTTTYERLVTARASANSITVNSAVLIPTAGVYFYYKKSYFSTNPADQMWVDVEGWTTAAYTWSVDANANTGGVVTSLQCSPNEGPEWPTGRWVEPRDTSRTANPTTTPSGSTQADVTESIDLVLAPFKNCRFGFKFGTGDDADAANEDINLVLTLTK